MRRRTRARCSKDILQRGVRSVRRLARDTNHGIRPLSCARCFRTRAPNAASHSMRRRAHIRERCAYGFPVARAVLVQSAGILGVAARHFACGRARARSISASALHSRLVSSPDFSRVSTPLSSEMRRGSTHIRCKRSVGRAQRYSRWLGSSAA